MNLDFSDDLQKVRDEARKMHDARSAAVRTFLEGATRSATSAMISRSFPRASGGGLLVVITFSNSG